MKVEQTTDGDPYQYVITTDHGHSFTITESLGGGLIIKTSGNITITPLDNDTISVNT